MTFPTIPTTGNGRIVSVGNTAGGANKTYTNPWSGLTWNAGELLIAIVVEYDGNSTNAEFSSWSHSFVEFVDQATTTTMGIGVAYKWASGSESGNVTVITADTSTNDSVLILASIPGAHDSTPPEGGTIGNGTTGAAAIAALNPTGWDAEDTLWIAVCGAGETSTTGAFTAPSAAPTNYNNLFVTALTADVVGGVYGAVAFRQLNAASDDPDNFTVDTSNARNSALLLAVRPSAFISGSATLTGAGTLTASGAALDPGPALSPLTQPVGQRIIWITPGSVQASVIPPPAVPAGPTGDATLTGAGTLSAAGVITGAATLTGAGVLTASGQVIGLVNGDATLTGAGSLTATAMVTAGSGPVFVPLRQPGGLRVIQWRTGHVQFSPGVHPSFSQGSQTLIGAGTLTATATVTDHGSAALAGAGSLSATGSVGGIVNGDAALVGAGSLTAAGVRTATATLTGAGVLTSAGRITGAASLVGAGTLIATGVYIARGDATLAGAGILAAAGFEIPFISQGTASSGTPAVPTAVPGTATVARAEPGTARVPTAVGG